MGEDRYREHFYTYFGLVQEKEFGGEGGCSRSGSDLQYTTVEKSVDRKGSVPFSLILGILFRVFSRDQTMPSK